MDELPAISLPADVEFFTRAKCIHSIHVLTQEGGVELMKRALAARGVVGMFEEVRASLDVAKLREIVAWLRANGEN